MQQLAAILYPRIKPWEAGNAESPILDLDISHALSPHLSLCLVHKAQQTWAEVWAPSAPSAPNLTH